MKSGIIIWIGLLLLIPFALADDLNVSTCVPLYECSAGSCQQNNTVSCTVVTDTICGAPYLYPVSSFYKVCVYPIPVSNPTIAVVTDANNAASNESVQAITDLKISDAKQEETTVDFTGETINLTKINATTIVVEYRRVFIDTAIIPELNKPATLKFYNIAEGWHIYKNGMECGAPTCTNIVYDKDNKVLTFDVTGFSEYTIGTYTIGDMALIVADGIGTFLASIVELLELIVLAGALFVGAYILTKAIENYK